MDEYDQSLGQGDSTEEMLRQRIAQLEARVAHDEQLVAEQRRLNDLLPLLVATAGFDGFYKEVNAAFERTLGWTREESLARPFLDFIHADDRAAASAAFDRLKAGEPAIDFLDRNLCRDGSYRWIRWIVMPIPNQQQVFGIGQDVTEWKHAEDDRCRAAEAVQQARNELEQRIRERTAALESEQRALRRMMMASDHERRLITYELHDGVAQHLTAAILQLQMLHQELVQSEARAAASCQTALEAVRRAATELRVVMSRLRTPVLDKFGLVDAIEDVVSQLQTGEGSPHIEYHHDVAFRRLEPTLENALFRIAQEALTNACRHSQSDRVRIELTQSSQGGTLQIRDWGCGFDQQHVTENRFGLEGIRERARLLGGTCTIRSAPGEGTVVRVDFPVLEQPKD